MADKPKAVVLLSGGIDSTTTLVIAVKQGFDVYALVLADELGMRPLQAHCHLGLGRLYGQTGRRESARVALSAAIELYRTMDMTFWLPQAEATRAQVA